MRAAGDEALSNGGGAGAGVDQLLIVLSPNGGGGGSALAAQMVDAVLASSPSSQPLQRAKFAKTHSHAPIVTEAPAPPNGGSNRASNTQTPVAVEPTAAAAGPVMSAVAMQQTMQHMQQQQPQWMMGGGTGTLPAPVFSNTGIWPVTASPIQSYMLSPADHQPHYAAMLTNAHRLMPASPASQAQPITQQQQHNGVHGRRAHVHTSLTPPRSANVRHVADNVRDKSGANTRAIRHTNILQCIRASAESTDTSGESATDQYSRGCDRTNKYVLSCIQISPHSVHTDISNQQSNQQYMMNQPDNGQHSNQVRLCVRVVL
jgi:hypothetical protein